MGTQLKGTTFPLKGDAVVHLCIDMQRLFADTRRGGCLGCRVSCRRSSRSHPATPSEPFSRGFPRLPLRKAAQGAWKSYYDRWPEMTRAELDPGLLELVEPLARLVPPASQVEKPANSAFSRPGFAAALRRRGVDTLVVTGGEPMSAY